MNGAEPSGEYTAENATISWRVTNSGPFTTNQTFTVEIRFDGTTVTQWTSKGLSRNAFIFVDDVEGLLSGITITPGVHEISLVADPFDVIAETDESDNISTRLITMIGTEQPAISPDLLPNLVPIPYSGKTEPLFASSHPDDRLTGKLSVDRPTHVTIAAHNASIQYITEKIELDIYLDDVMARRVVWNDLSANRTVEFAIDSLQDLIQISPGPHTLRLEVDPLNRVRESDETDNVYEVRLIWGVGEPPAAEVPFILELPPREPVTLPNFAPFRRFGWDAAITASTARVDFSPGKDSWLQSSDLVRIDIGFTNASRVDVPSTNDLMAHVLLDGELIEQLAFISGSSNVGSIWTSDFLIAADTVLPGEHTVRVVLDPGNLVEELDEDDNIFERTFTWNDGPDPEKGGSFQITDEEIAAAFAPLFGEMRREVRPVLGPGSGDRDWTPEIMAAGRAVYFLLTGRDLEDEGYALHFLPPDEFRDSSVASCMSSWVTMTSSQYEDKFKSCTRERGEVGFKTRSNGQIHLFVDLGLSPLDALGTYMHELGHGLQDLVNPEQTVQQGSINSRGLFEAQAQIFEAAGWRAIEQFTGQSLSSYPDIVQARTQFTDRFALRRDRETEHDIGYRLLWARALSPESAPGIASQLRTEGKLDSASAMELFNLLAELEPAAIERWAADLLARTDLFDEFEQIAIERFIPDIGPESTGHPALQDSNWTAP